MNHNLQDKISKVNNINQYYRQIKNIFLLNKVFYQPIVLVTLEISCHKYSIMHKNKKQ